MSGLLITPLLGPLGLPLGSQDRALRASGVGGGSAPAAGTVVFQLNLEDGTNNLQDAVDQSPSPRTITWSAGAKVSTATAFEGTKSLDVSVLAEYATFPNYDFGTNDFCIEYYWLSTDHGPTYLNSVMRSTVNGFWHNETQNNAWLLVMEIMGLTLGGTLQITEDVWRHMAIVREGTTISMYVDGVLNDSGAVLADATFGASTGYVCMGANRTSVEAWYQGTCHLDMIRFTDGVPVYTGPFTPPTSF